MDDSAQGIAAVDNRGWTKQDLNTVKDTVVDRNGVLEVARSVNGIVHTDAVNHKQDLIGLKST